MLPRPEPADVELTFKGSQIKGSDEAGTRPVAIAGITGIREQRFPSSPAQLHEEWPPSGAG